MEDWKQINLKHASVLYRNELEANESLTIEENKKLLKHKAKVGDILTFNSGLVYRRIDGRKNNDVWLEGWKKY